MLVMDETFDMWAEPKSEDDYALRFAEWWEADVEAMVRKDLNHPSVILYSIGNEIPEAGRPEGARVGRALAEKIRSLDGTRLVTQAVSGLLVGGRRALRRAAHEASADRSAGGGRADGRQHGHDQPGRPAEQPDASPVGRQEIGGDLSYLDVAGYNYMESRYELDGGLYPNRVIVGSETHPAAIDTRVGRGRRYPHVIGDFTWTGWDYLGEAGIGRTVYGEPDGRRQDRTSFLGEFPWLTAWCGDIDITGHRRPQSYYREIVFGRRADPYLAVRRPSPRPTATTRHPWSWSDVVSTWSWDGFERRPVTVEVYADGDEVELLRATAARSAGGPVGAEHRFRAEFEVSSSRASSRRWPGATGERSGDGVCTPPSGPVVLDVGADRPGICADPGDLAFVTSRWWTPRGAVHSSADRHDARRGGGPGVLQALGARTRPAEEGSRAPPAPPSTGGPWPWSARPVRGGSS